MIPLFQVNRLYDVTRDVRDFRELFAQLESPCDGLFWPLIGNRRGGKTWALWALEHHLRGRGAPARVLDLRNYGELPEPGETHVLLDEPQLVADGHAGARAVAPLLQWCARLRERGQCVVMAMTPAEWQVIRDFGRGPDHKCLRFLGPMHPTEAEKMAARDPSGAALELLARLPAGWRGVPALLELLLGEHQRDPAAALPELLRRTLRVCERIEHAYFHYVFEDSLTAEQRAQVRRIAWGEVGAAVDPMLRETGVVVGDKGEARVADPVLLARLAPLRIHHISDIHIGPKSAVAGDLKADGGQGERMGEVAGVDAVRELYRRHLAQIAGEREAPHLLVVSGDLVEWAIAAQLQTAQQWLASLRPHLADHPWLREQEPRILLVGGNHDVDWQRTDPGDPQARHRAFAAAFAEYPHPHLELPPGARGRSIVRYVDLGVEFVLLGSAELGGETTTSADVDALVGLIEQLRSRLRGPGTAEAAGEVGEAATLPAARRIDPGMVHHEALKALLARSDASTRIAVLHHPLSPLPNLEISRFGGLLNAGAVKAALFDGRVCLALHGHVHVGGFSEERWPDRYPDFTLRIASAPSLGSREISESNGFNEIVVYRDWDGTHNTAQIVVRRWRLDGQRWQGGSKMGPFDPVDGGRVG